MEDPNEFEIDMDIPTPPEVEKLDKIECREVCWDLKERGAVGETILHLCLLNATSIHADLAKRLLKFYPKLINDIYISDEYYGESVLHVAIVNEDPSMVKFLLDSGADFHERCIGNFMCSEDQKASRSDSLDHEWVNLTTETNYEGYVYWGEYPLSFAACLGQEECYRLMLARGANASNQDTNGNTVLHMLVIYEKIASFDMAYEVGADLDIKNVLNLTPLTLAAKLARIEMFFHILKIEREIYWQIGSITCAAYPLTQIDTIDNKTGHISNTSALNLVVFGDKDEHLELMDGVLVDLLNAKWNTFVKFRFYRQFFQFSLYFLLSLICFTLRPGPPSADGNMQVTSEMPEMTEITYAEKIIQNDTQSASEMLTRKHSKRYSQQEFNYTVEYSKNASSNFETTTQSSFESSSAASVNGSSLNMNNDVPMSNQRQRYYNVADSLNFTENTPRTRTSSNGFFTTDYNETSESDVPSTTFYYDDEVKENETIFTWWQENVGTCRLMAINDYKDMFRLITECVLELGALLYILSAFREAGFLGLNMFIENLMSEPSRVMFLFSCLLMMIIPFLRFSCSDEIEDMMIIVIMLTTSPYFLFFCRGFKTVGPFVVMIYRMVIGDLLRFVCIYLVFVMGFSQAYYIIFLSFDNPGTPDGTDDSVSNPMPSPSESIMAMFLMSMNTFSDYYTAFDNTNHTMVAKFCFVVFMVIVAILLVNMLIAMMGNTYQKIAETRNEWQRQWARIVLVVERGVSPRERLKKLMMYSQPMSDGRRALVLRLNQTEEDKEEMKEILEMKRSHNKNVQKLKMRNQKLQQQNHQNENDKTIL
ncbi:transient receptor potential cation channel subfamily V member 5 isoform X2 [Planococcus citri]